MPDRTWAPEVVKKVARSVEVVCSDGNSEARAVAIDMLSASPLPDALDLIERLILAAHTPPQSSSSDATVQFKWCCQYLDKLTPLMADAAAFVARVREG
jgi:hypothetical protein